ncbi:Hydroxyacylglutathione hydrolase [Spraguea lophii 42_110]|uniref:Hydroxyacylglutathione hydrolase n=1 Tax=Spraguea lophii (strain 42_110) TaxID=1358809 RepID=S7W9A8_SPRLO|nr:Hydroxyacylglutathione hydrolase [Spraguea lophii 42_110]
MKLVAISKYNSGGSITYMFYDDNKAIVFDPSHPRVVEKALKIDLQKDHYSPNEIMDAPETHRRTLLMAFSTDNHPGHSTGLNIHRDSLGARIINGFDEPVCHDGDKFFVDEMEIEAIYSEGHTDVSFSFLCKSDKNYLIAGDTLLFLGCGQFYSNDSDEYKRTLDKIDSRVPDDTIILYGHDIKDKAIKFAEKFLTIPDEIKNKKYLTLAENKQYNPVFHIDRLEKTNVVQDMEDLIDLEEDVFKEYDED